MNVFLFIKKHELERKANISILKRGLFIIMYNGRHSTLTHFPKQLTSCCPINTFWKLSRNDPFHIHLRIHSFTPRLPAEFSVCIFSSLGECYLAYTSQSWGLGSQVKRVGGKRISRLCSSLELTYWAIHGLQDLLGPPKLTGAHRISHSALKHTDVND